MPLAVCIQPDTLAQVLLVLSWQNTQSSGILICYLITLSFQFHPFPILILSFSLKPVHKDQAGRMCSVAVNQWAQKIQNVNS